MKVRVSIPTEVEAKETDTTGRNTYVVALVSGGLMESPEINYTDFQLIHANSKIEARKKYNEINECNFFYGCVLEEL